MKTFLLAFLTLNFSIPFLSAQDDHGNTRETATPMNSSDIVGNLDTDDTDWFRITLNDSGHVWIYTTGNTDTYGALFNDSGNTVYSGANDSNDGYEYNFRLSGKLDPGTYYLRVNAGTQGNATGSYLLSLRTFQNATPFDSGEFVASPGRFGEIDLYRIYIPDPSRFFLYTTGATDTYGTLYDDSGNVEFSGANDSNDGAGDNFLLTGTVSPGTYYLKVEASGSFAAGRKTGDYRLILRDSARSVPLTSPGRSDHRLSPAGDLDLFAFATPGGAVTFQTYGTTDTYGTLYDSAGRVEISGANDSNDGEGDNFLIGKTLDPGNYYLIVRGQDTSLTTGAYTLDATFTPGPLLRLSAGGTLVASTGTSSLQITATASWTVLDLPSWITTSRTSGSGNASLTFTYAANLSGRTREATVSVGGQPYTVTQRAQGDFTGLPIPAQTTITQGVLITVPTQPGTSYRIETSDDMTTWLPTGTILQGDGTPKTAGFSRAEARKFFRAVPQ